MAAEERRVGPHGCSAALIIKGEHFWCDLSAPHDGWPHSSTDAEAIWRGVGAAEDAAYERPTGPVQHGSIVQLVADADDGRV